MQFYIANLHYMPSFLSMVLFFIIWIGFPIWLAMRRKQGLIHLGSLDREGSPRMVERYFELGIFFFAIPFTTFFVLVTANFILSIFIADAAARFQTSFEVASLIMDIILILYIYLVERKIRLDHSNKDQ